jgi:hypothetical protein
MMEDDGFTGASEHVRARLLAEVRSIGRARRRRSFVALAAAAGIVTVVGLGVWQMTGAGTLDEETHAGPNRTEVTTPFFALLPGAMPSSTTHIVRVEVPRRALASFGLATREVAQSSSDTVLADLLVGDDGLARAVRFVQVTALLAALEERKR